MLTPMRAVRWEALGLFCWGLSACDGTTVSRVATRVEAEPARVDFGTVELTQQAARIVALRNLEASPIAVQAVAVDDDCGGCFGADFLSAGRIIAASGALDLQVRFRPARRGLSTATVTVALDDPGASTVEVLLAGRGREGCRPDVEVAPSVVDFGFVPAGGVAVSAFTVRSAGDCDLLVDRISVVPAAAPFRITTSTPTPAMPGVLTAGAEARVSLRAALDSAATSTEAAAIEIETNVDFEKNVPGRPGVVRIPLSARPNRPPVAVAGDDFTVEPWSRANLDGAMSFDPDGLGESLEYRWRLVARPGGSTTRLERANRPQSSFWADLTGVYELELTVVDERGLASEPARVVVEALPTNALRIELTWDHPDSDVDLHLIRAGGRFCQCVEDVHYRDCGRAPEWFTDAPGANPRLDVDDRAGFGPENINIDGDGPDRFVPDGAYEIAVHYFASNADVSTWPTRVSTATVRVFIFGLLAAEFTRALEADGDLWRVAEVRWPEQTVTALTGFQTGAMCGLF
ncbi:MAG: choice-of-anchor D domain-containing protein [Myxococcota bacterium]